MVPDKNIGVIVLTNETNVGFPDALGQWILDRILGNPKVDYVAEKLKEAKASFEKSTKLFAKPASPRPFPPLPPLAGKFVNPSFGEAAVAPDGDALVMELQATGAKFKLVPWDGDIFIATLMPTGRFGAMVASGVTTIGFVQFQMDKEGKLNLLRLSTRMVRLMSSGANRRLDRSRSRSLAPGKKAATAQPLRPIPLFVLTAGQPFDLSSLQPLPADFPEALNKAWHTGQDALATLAPNDKHIIATKSGHNIQVSGTATGD